MAPDNALTLIVVLVAMAGVLIALSLWTVARTVARLKHPDWSFTAAFGYVYTRGLIAFALTGAVIAAIWFYRGGRQARRQPRWGYGSS